MSLENEVGERSTDDASPGLPALRPRMRWYRGRPPEYFDRFSRVVWWCGQIQLFIAVGAVPTGLFLVGAAIVAQLSLAHGSLLVGATALGLAAPIALSGFMLRRASSQIESFGPFKRWLELIAWVLVIAGIATIAALVSIYLAVWGVLIASSVVSALSA